jgi:hypothetical protein
MLAQLGDGQVLLDTLSGFDTVSRTNGKTHMNWRNGLICGCVPVDTYLLIQRMMTKLPSSHVRLLVDNSKGRDEGT